MEAKELARWLEEHDSAECKMWFRRGGYYVTFTKWYHVPKSYNPSGMVEVFGSAQGMQLEKVIREAMDYFSHDLSLHSGTNFEDWVAADRGME